MALILNRLGPLFLACSVWHGFNLKQSGQEQRGVSWVCSPQAAAKEGATTPRPEDFPLHRGSVAAKACWLQNVLHTGLSDLLLCLFASQVEEVELS